MGIVWVCSDPAAHENCSAAPQEGMMMREKRSTFGGFFFFKKTFDDILTIWCQVKEMHSENL